MFKMRPFWLIVVTVFLFLQQPAVFAGVYKCKNSGGQTVFQDRPCRNPGNTEPTTPPNNPDQGQHFLWKASTENSTVHLFGSLHFGSTEMYPLPEVVTQAYTGSDALVVEVNTNQANTQELMKSLQQMGAYPMGETLQEHIAPEIWEKLSKLIKKQGLDINAVSSQKPWLISLSLATLAIQKSGFSPKFGIDQYFINGAVGNKPIIELESAQQQLKLLTTFSSLEQNRLLKETLDQLDQGPSYFRSMLTAWQTGDSQRMTEITQQDIDTDPEARRLYEILFTSRNHSMADRIVELSRSGENYFVVVGAGHLVGSEGIVELLRARGYQVSQL